MLKHLEEYIQLYNAYAKIFGFTPGDTNTTKGQQEAVRYLIVCGRIKATKDVLAFLGEKDFYLDGTRLEGLLLREASARVKESTEDKWEYDEDTPLGKVKVKEPTIAGIWLKNGQITGIKIAREELGWSEVIYALVVEHKAREGDAEEIQV